MNSSLWDFLPWLRRQRPRVALLSTAVCGVLQCVAVCCSVLQCVSVSFSVFQCFAMFRSVSQCVAVCSNVSQCVVVCHSVSQCTAVCCSVLQCIAVCCSVLQCATVCCGVLQCAAVCCSTLRATLPSTELHGVLQCVAARHLRNISKRNLHTPKKPWQKQNTPQRDLHTSGKTCEETSSRVTYTRHTETTKRPQRDHKETTKRPQRDLHTPQRDQWKGLLLVCDIHTTYRDH